MKSFLQNLREANQMRKRVWPGPRATLEFRGLEFAGEAGELCGGLKKYVRALNGTAGNTKTEDEIFDNICEEVGDVMITLDLICNELNIDIADCTIAKFNSKSEEIGNPVKMSNGTGQPFHE